MRVRTNVLHYYERSNHKYRDLRDIEVNFKVGSKKKFARISLNGQYRTTKSQKNATRYANPGWTLGTENVHINWTHFRRHCFHISANAVRRGITLSYGRSVI